MGNKVNYQSVVHGSYQYTDKSGKTKKTYTDEGIVNSYKRAVKQAVDTLAPGFNPRRTRNRTGQDNQ